MHADAVTPAGLRAQAGGRCLVMGVVNVTPDSFSDGGEWFEPDAAIAHGLDLLAQGADLLDVGGESTRPGPAGCPSRRSCGGCCRWSPSSPPRERVVSVDTTRAEVAAAGAGRRRALVNDVSGGLADPDLPHVVADAGVPYVVMHWRGHSADMDALAVYDDGRSVAATVRDELRGAGRRPRPPSGVDPELLVLDPGLGFAKSGEHNWQVLQGLDELLGLGLPVLSGPPASGSSATCSPAPTAPAPPTGRDAATAATSALAAPPGSGRCGCTRSRPPSTPSGWPGRGRAGPPRDRAGPTPPSRTGSS